MPSRPRLYDILGADPYSYRRQQDMDSGANARYVMRLKQIPANVASHVTSRLALQPFDWWWIPRSDATGHWIEVSIREAAVLRLIQPETA